MMRALFLAVAVACAPFAALGCGGGDAGTTPAPAPLDPLVRAFCKTARSCCAATGSPAEPLADCETEFVRQVDYFTLVAKGTVTIDQAALSACATTFDQLAATCTITNLECPRFAFGTIADGAPCDDSEECRGVSDRPTVCLKAGVMPGSAPVPGVCQAIPFGKEGDGCTLSCPKGQNCSFTLTTSQANPVVAICREEDGLYCTAGRCTPRVVDGAACASDAACASTSYCDTVCKPRKAAGDACARLPECSSPLSCTAGACTTGSFATAKICSGDYN